MSFVLYLRRICVLLCKVVQFFKMKQYILYDSRDISQVILTHFVRFHWENHSKSRYASFNSPLPILVIVTSFSCVIPQNSIFASRVAKLTESFQKMLSSVPFVL